MIESKIYITQLFENICIKDDRKSFEEIFKLLYERLLNFCINYVKHRETAEEIVSDVFLKLWLKRKDISHVANIESYLFIAVKNHSLNYLKQFSNYRIVYLEDAGGHELVTADNPENELERKEIFFKMNQAIDALPQQCKIIFKLIKEDGFKYKEVAEILNLSPRTVETQLVRAMRKLDKTIEPYLDFNRKLPKGKDKIFPLIKPLLFSIFIFVACK